MAGKYILGGGITGLVTAFYNPEYTLITDQVGGQMSVKGMGPRLLEVNDNSAMLLEDLGYDTVNIKTATVGYVQDGKELDSLTEAQRKAYYMKSRCLEDAASVPPSVMSDGKKELKYFDIDMSDLVTKIFALITNKIILGKAIKIDTENQTLEVELTEKKTSKLDYEHLVSTIPAPLFYKLSGLKPEEKFETIPKSFIIVAEQNIDMRGYDYIYFPGKECEYHRISKVGNGLVSIEYTSKKVLSYFSRKWNHIMRKSYRIDNGQISKGKINEIKNVSFIGRYACWDHDLKTDDVVQQAKEMRREWFEE